MHYFQALKTNVFRNYMLLSTAVAHYISRSPENKTKVKFSRCSSGKSHHMMAAHLKDSNGTGVRSLKYRDVAAKWKKNLNIPPNAKPN